MAAKSLEEREGALRVKEAQILEALNHHQSLKKQSSSIIRETRLVSADLRQRLDVQEEEGEKLMQITEGMCHGECLEFWILINTRGFEEIRVYCSNLALRRS